MKRRKKRYRRRAFCLGRRHERVQNVRAGQKSVVTDDDVTALTATVNGGRIKCPWKVVYTEDEDDADSGQEKAEKGYTLPEYAFTVECSGAESGESGQLDVRDEMAINFSDTTNIEGKTLVLKWKDGSDKSIKITNKKIVIKDIYIGTASFYIK